MLKYCLLSVGILYLSGCSTIQPQPAETAPIPDTQAIEVPPLPEPVIETPSSEKKILDRILAQYHEWKGTRYRMGSLSKKGVDCSGFVLLTFREQLGIELPRSTREQNQLGQEVKRNQLITGDLVFFHTGRNKHVGIYLQNDEFLHASTRAGVKISKLSDPYWRSRYWKAKRLDLSNTEKSTATSSLQK